MGKTVYESRILNDGINIEPNEFDFFLLAVGSDYRAYESLRIAEKNNKNISNILLFEFEERVNCVGREQLNKAKLYEQLKYKINKISCSIKNPSDALKKLQKLKGINIDAKSSIGVDISCFTKPYFFTLLNMLKKVYKVEKVVVFYTEPKSYLFDKGLYSSYHSSQGPIRVEEIPSFTGNEADKSKKVLIIMLGFDGDLSSEALIDVSPKETIVVNGFPSYSPKFKDISLISNEKLVTADSNVLLYSRANNPFETYNLLDKLSVKYNDFYINIAPLGTKPMALGVCMFAIHNPDVRIVYPIPDKFENETTDDCWNTWSFQIPLIKKT